MGPEVVDRRTLNRTLLARQWLHPVAPAGASVHDVLEHLVGLQAQDVTAPYVGMWSRLPSSTPAEVGDALLDRSAVRIATLRSTIHLHTAADALPVRRWTQAVTENGLRSSRAAAWPLVDRDRLVREVRRLLQDAPVLADDLGRALTAHWPQVAPVDLQMFARAFVPMVQTPPRGVWGSSGRTAYAAADDWLGGPGAAPDPAALVLRHLAAFGPASVRDVQVWCGLTRLREVTDRMDLRRYVDEDGVELLDTPDGELVDGDTPVPPLFVAPFDNLTLSHADRRRVIDGEARRIIASRNGIVPGTVLVDGFVAASWRVERGTLQVTPFGRLSRRRAAGLLRPGRQLLGMLLGERAGEVEIRPAVT